MDLLFGGGSSSEERLNSMPTGGQPGLDHSRIVLSRYRNERKIFTPKCKKTKVPCMLKNVPDQVIMNGKNIKIFSWCHKYIYNTPQPIKYYVTTLFII